MLSDDKLVSAPIRGVDPIRQAQAKHWSGWPLGHDPIGAFCRLRLLPKRQGQAISTRHAGRIDDEFFLGEYELVSHLAASRQYGHSSVSVVFAFCRDTSMAFHGVSLPS